MEQIFLGVAAATGAVVLLASVWAQFRPHEHRSTVASAVLPLVGFVLVGAPVWTSITVKTEQLEIAVERQRKLIEALADAPTPSGGSPFVPFLPDSRVEELAERVDRGEVEPKTLTRNELRALAQYTRRQTEQAIPRPWPFGGRR